MLRSREHAFILKLSAAAILSGGLGFLTAAHNARGGLVCFWFPLSGNALKPRIGGASSVAIEVKGWLARSDLSHSEPSRAHLLAINRQGGHIGAVASLAWADFRGPLQPTTAEALSSKDGQL